MAYTYDPIATNTVSGTTTNTISFTSIPATYTDLVFVFTGTMNDGTYYEADMQYNGDTGTNYSLTYMQGNGSSASSGRYTTTNKIRLGEYGLDQTTPSNQIVNIMNYANTTTYKTALIRYNETYSSAGNAGAKAALWRSTSAINRVDIYILGGKYFGAGTTATVYGIKAA